MMVLESPQPLNKAVPDGRHRKAGARARLADHPGDYDGSCRYADDHIETGARDDGLPPLSGGFAGTPRESRTRNVDHLDQVEQARRKFR